MPDKLSNALILRAQAGDDDPAGDRGPSAIPGAEDKTIRHSTSAAANPSGQTQAPHISAQTKRGPVPVSRADFLLIRDLVDSGTRILDVGCNDGSLLELLQESKQVDGRGIELSHAGVKQCLSRGLSVVQGDADTDLAAYPDNSFDYVILSQTIQATHRPREVLGQLLRIGHKAIVSFPNFGYWRFRIALLAGGKMPVTAAAPYSWYETPNIHFCTMRDFFELCTNSNVHIEHVAAFTGAGHRLPQSLIISNLWAEQAVFLLSRHPGA